jgi:hypothetical protein
MHSTDSNSFLVRIWRAYRRSPRCRGVPRSNFSNAGSDPISQIQPFDSLSTPPLQMSEMRYKPFLGCFELSLPLPRQSCKELTFRSSRSLTNNTIPKMLPIETHPRRLFSGATRYTLLHRKRSLSMLTQEGRQRQRTGLNPQRRSFLLLFSVGGCWSSYLPSLTMGLVWPWINRRYLIIPRRRGYSNFILIVKI